jgi:phosphotriesterase-related protein
MQSVSRGQVRESEPPPMMRHWNYLHISKDVLPMLRAKGVNDDQIQQMLVDNPRRILPMDSLH